MKKNKSLIRLLFKTAVVLAVIVVILGAVSFLGLPRLLSSGFGRDKVVNYLSSDLQRPVAIESMSFSWRVGISLSNLNIKNQDQSPFLSLKDFRVIPSWRALLAQEVKITTLNIEGIDLTITRDKQGKTNISDLFESPAESGRPDKKKSVKDKTSKRKTFSALFLEAHVKDGRFIFVDQRLKSATRIDNFSADLSIQSLAEPIKLSAQGDVVLNNNPPEPLELTGNFILAPEGEFDPRKAQGNLKMEAGFGHLEGSFDLNKFNTTTEATGGSLSCSLNLNKLSEILAGILGFPPGYSFKGKLDSQVEARGNFESSISIQGETRLSGLSFQGGPFKDRPFSQPRIDFIQEVKLNFPAGAIEIKTLKAASGFANLALSGTIKSFQKEPVVNLRLSGDGKLADIAGIMGGPLELPPDLRLAGAMGLSLTGSGELNALTIKGSTIFKDLRLEAGFLKGHPFQEAELRILPDITVNIPENRFNINSLSLKSESLNGTVKGVFDKENNVDLSASVSTTFPYLKRQFPKILPAYFPNEGTLSSDISIKGNLSETYAVTVEENFKGEALEGKIKGTLDKEDNVDLTASVSTTFPYLKKQFQEMLPQAFPNQGTISSDLTIKGNRNTSLVIKGDHTLAGLLPPPQNQSKLKIIHDLVYAADQDNINLNSITAQSPFFNLEGKGAVVNLSEQKFTKCEGNLTLDLAETRKILKDAFPEKMSAKGKGRLTFAGEGNLKPPNDKPVLSSWKGNGDLSLDTVYYQGLGSLQGLKSTELFMEKGILKFALECLLNNGPSNLQGTVDFNSKRPLMKINAGGEDIDLSHDQKILGHIIPISSQSSKLTGKGNFTLEASWQGTKWEGEINRSIAGGGRVSLNDGTLRSEKVLSVILNALGRPETIQFDEIFTNFRLQDGRIYNDDIQVIGKDINLKLQGWTSLIYDQYKKGNPMEYTVGGESIKQLMGKDGEKVLSFMGGTIPVNIGGTVQKPKVSIKMPSVKDILPGLFSPRKR